MSKELPSYDVAIVGYGPVGAVFANLLARRGLKVAVIERNEDGSCVVQLTRTPMDFRDAAYRQQYLALLEKMAPHRYLPAPPKPAPRR